MGAGSEEGVASERGAAAGREAAWQRGLLWALRLGLGGLLLWSGVVKVGDPASFAAEIGNYHFLPSLAPIMAVTMPSIEIVIGLALIAAPRVWLRAAALAAAAVLGVFTVAVISVVARGIDVECGCFGSGSGPVTMVTVLRDVVLVAAALGVYALAREPGPTRSAGGDEPAGAPV